MTLGAKAERTKVAVLGGGAGALSAVWGLLNSPDADRYDITIYQMGWRLGGKARSGRNRAYAHRIEEGGAQIWSGAYHNAFRMMRQVYRELDRAPDAPLSAWYDPDHPERSAFLPEDKIALFEFERGGWQESGVDFAPNAERIGQDVAKLMGRCHERCPLPAAPRAGRRIGFGNSDRAGAADRGSRRRAGALFCELEPCSARKHVMGRSAGPVEPNCHGLNIATVRSLVTPFVTLPI